MTEGKVPYERPIYRRQHLFSLEVLVFLMLIHTFRSLSGVIFDTNQNEDNSNFLFLIGAEMSG